MGGKAFEDLSVPRLPHELYHRIRTQCHEVLTKLYTNVVTPPEAPEKPDHGDVDFLVTRPISSDASSSRKICEALGAADMKLTTNSNIIHFALPIPEREDEFAQVDVHICDSSSLDWELFSQSYGDLMQILGVLNRPVGLTATDKGLHVRIPEIEPTNKKKAMIWLTADPKQMMHFLGLNVDKYEFGFATNEEVFEWCFRGHYYGPLTIRAETSNDRTRLKKRDMFTTAVREYFPAHLETLFPTSRKRWTREEVLSEALTSFPAARPMYEAAMQDYRQEVWEASLLAEVKALSPTADEKDGIEVLRGTKRFVTFEGGQWKVSDVVLFEDVSLTPHWVAFVKTEEERARFLLWMQENWMEVKAREKARVKAKKGGVVTLAVTLENAEVD